MVISTVEVHNTATLKVLHPLTGDVTDMTVETYGVASKEYTRSLTLLNKENSKECLSGDDRNKNTLKHYARLIVGWSNIQELNDKKKIVDVICNVDSTVALFEKQPWFYFQVMGFINKDKNFLSVSENS